MVNEEYMLQLVNDLKTERGHQIDFIQKLECFYDRLNRKGFGPLSPLLQSISTWKQNLSLIEDQIREVESKLSP